MGELRITETSDGWIVEMEASVGAWTNVTTDVYATREEAEAVMESMWFDAE